MVNFFSPRLETYCLMSIIALACNLIYAFSNNTQVYAAFVHLSKDKVSLFVRDFCKGSEIVANIG